MTLVEVVASLLLLGGLVGAVVVAKGRLSRQWSVATQRHAAAARLDGLLELWHRGAGVPVGEEGTLPVRAELVARIAEQEATAMDRADSADDPRATATLDGLGGSAMPQTDSDGLRWRTRPLERAAWEPLGLEAVAVEVWSDRRSGAAGSRVADVLLTVEVFRYVPSDKQTSDGGRVIAAPGGQLSGRVDASEGPLP